MVQAIIINVILQGDKTNKKQWLHQKWSAWDNWRKSQIIKFLISY